MFVLDTNVISEIRKGNRADLKVISWAKNVPTSSLYLSVITILEIEMGILLKQKKDISQAQILRTWMDTHVLPSFSERILPIDTAVAKRCAKLHVPDPKSERDALIAATALVHGMTLVSRNVQDFERTGIEVYNPWD